MAVGLLFQVHHHFERGFGRSHQIDDLHGRFVVDAGRNGRGLAALYGFATGRRQRHYLANESLFFRLLLLAHLCWAL